MSTAIIIDPAVKDYAGHHFTAAAGWAEAARASGFDVRILGHRECVAKAAGAASIEKTFSGEFYHVAPSDQKEAWKRLRNMQREFRDALAIPLMHVQPDDVVILSHSTLVTLNGLAAWASGMPQQQLPRLAPWLMVSPEEEDFVVPFGSTNCLATAIDRLRALFGDRLTLTGSTPEVSRQWEALGCGPIHVLPYMALRPEIRAQSDRAISSPPSILFAGHFGARKGLHLIPGIIKNIEQRGIQVRWMFAGSSFETNSPEFAEIARLAKTGSSASLVVSQDGVDEYNNYIKSADLAVLPYSPEVYRIRGSGVAEEAALLGLPYVAPKVDFSADSASAGAAICFDTWTVEGVAAAVAEAVSALPQLSRGAGIHALLVQERLRETRAKVLSFIFGERADETTAPRARVNPLPGVDIIVTLHNYRKFLRECLESVSRQSYPNWRCIVVDDGSTDITFDELRTIVRSFGDRFTCERHGRGGGQIKAIATGLSLGANPFVLMLDADDCLAEDALDSHLSWHLNSRVPASFTSGRVQVVDELGRRIAGCLDNIIWLDYADMIADLPLVDAYRRMDTHFVPPSASFIKQDCSGRWFWNPTSALMFRRNVVELLLPDSMEIGALGGDTYFAFAAHAIGGSILIDKHVASYRRHGSNGYSDMGVYGAGTMAARSSSSSWEEVKRNLQAHIRSNLNRFLHQIRPDHISRLLDQTVSIEKIQTASVEAIRATSVHAMAIYQFSFWMARRRILFGLARRLLLGRRGEVRLIIERSLCTHGIPDVLAAPLTDQLSAFRVLLGLTRRSAFMDLNTVQKLIAAIMMQHMSAEREVTM